MDRNFFVETTSPYEQCTPIMHRWYWASTGEKNLLTGRCYGPIPPSVEETQTDQKTGRERQEKGKEKEGGARDLDTPETGQSTR